MPLQLLSRPNPTAEILKTYSAVLQQFVTHLYGVCQNYITTVEAARHHLILNKGKEFLQMPPGSDALHQHLLRVAYQSGYVWGNMLIKVSEPVPLNDWIWQQDTPNSAPLPLYTAKPILSKKSLSWSAASVRQPANLHTLVRCMRSPVCSRVPANVQKACLFKYLIE